jgi:hypothetical protein
MFSVLHYSNCKYSFFSDGVIAESHLIPSGDCGSVHYKRCIVQFASLKKTHTLCIELSLKVTLKLPLLLELMGNTYYSVFIIIENNKSYPKMFIFCFSHWTVTTEGEQRENRQSCSSFCDKIWKKVKVYIKYISKI